jgi:hypothetical protein
MTQKKTRKSLSLFREANVRVVAVVSFSLRRALFALSRDSVYVYILYINERGRTFFGRKRGTQSDCVCVFLFFGEREEKRAFKNLIFCFCVIPCACCVRVTTTCKCSLATTPFSPWTSSRPSPTSRAKIFSRKNFHPLLCINISLLNLIL